MACSEHAFLEERRAHVETEPLRDPANHPRTIDAGASSVQIYSTVSRCGSGQDRAHGGYGDGEQRDRRPPVAAHPDRVKVAQALLRGAPRRAPGAPPGRQAPGFFPLRWWLAARRLRARSRRRFGVPLARLHVPDLKAEMI